MSVSTCTHCGAPGVPYEYRGRRFDGLHDCRGERLCSGCLRVEPFAIRVTVGLHSWMREPGDDRVPLLPHVLKGETRRARGLSPGRRKHPA